MLYDISNYIIVSFTHQMMNYFHHKMTTKKQYLNKINDYPNKFYYLSLLQKEDEYGNMHWHIHGL